MKRLMEEYDNYALSISVTTRDPRPGEEDGGETFRVLYAEEKSGICGALYVRAVLEKEEKDDGNGA